MSFLVVNIAAPWQLASENIASLDFFPSLAEKDCRTERPATLGFFS